MSRHKRALGWTLGVGLFLLVPLSYRIWLEYKSAQVASKNLGSVESFVSRDTNDRPLTKEVLSQAVTIVINIPASCALDTCSMAHENASKIVNWVKDNLVIKHAEEKNSLLLLATGGGFTPPAESWRVVLQEPSPGSLLPRGFSGQKAWLSVIDAHLNFVGVWGLMDSIELDELQSALSRTTFEQYLSNYLVRRTFMGPKRGASTR